MIERKIEKRLHAFGSSCHLLIGQNSPGGAASLEVAEAELARLEAKFASFCPDSIIDSINHAAGTGAFTPWTPRPGASSAMLPRCGTKAATCSTQPRAYCSIATVPRESCEPQQNNCIEC